MLGLFAAAAIAAATPTTIMASARVSEPAVFMVRDADTTVYLFGTFHALDGNREWFNDRVRQAFDHSDELVLETLVPEQLPAPTRQIRAIAPAPSSPFLAGTRMAISAGRSQGMQAANGADMVLRRAAELDGKSVEGLESLESQFAMFARMPTAPGGPRSTGPQAMRKLSQSMVEMQDAWKHGDQAVFVRILGQLERGSPATYRMMFTERNSRWADWIRARMQTPGTVFVAVGAGHLAGKDSVLVQLAQRGIRSARVN